MKILVLSDSHAGLSFMRRCIEATQPDAIIHLGDYYSDGQTIAEEYPHIPLHQVPGNCDLHRGYIPEPEIRIMDLGGVRLYLTHGHRHGVKHGIYALVRDARAVNAQAVLFGHTHMALCRQEDGLWILNPGAGGSWGGSAGILVTERGKITHCSLIQAADLKDC